MSMQPSKSSGGFTLVEMMITVTLLSIVLVGVLESFTRQHKTSIVTENVVEVQQASRAISSLLEREIRMAGFMVPNSVGVCGIDSTIGPDQLFVSETEPIVPDDIRAADLGARIAGAGWNVGWVNGTHALVLDADSADLDGDGTYFYDNDQDGTNDSDFRLGGGFILGDLANPSRGAVCGQVASANAPTQLSVTVLAGQLVAYNAASDAPEDIVIVPAAHYQINAAPGTGRLERNGDLLAQGVDDFQISFFFDNDGDGVIDAGEERGRTAASSYDSGNEDHSMLKEVRFSVVVRTRATDPDFNNGAFINFENRAAVAGNDQFRRRAVTASVRPRNIGNIGGI